MMLKRSFWYASIAVGLIGGLLPMPTVAQTADTLLFVLRLDDVQSRSGISPRSLRPLEDAVEARGARLTYAVIPHRLEEPQNQDGVLAQELISAAQRGHEISLHGYTHICQRCGLSSHEMWCLTFRSPFTYAQQNTLIGDGTALLQNKLGITPTSFVPPGHITDTTTFEVLVDHGYGIISTNEAHAEPVREGLFNVAPNKEYTWAMAAGDYDARLQEALADIRAAEGYFALLLHDPFTRPGYEDGLTVAWVGELLDSLNASYGDRIRYVTVSEAAGWYQHRSTARQAPATLPRTAPLLTSYPNPFGTAATLTYTLPAAGPVRLTVFDLTGRTVATLVEGWQAAGPQSVRFEAGTLPSGFYLVRLQTAEGTAIRRLARTR